MSSGPSHRRHQTEARRCRADRTSGKGTALSGGRRPVPQPKQITIDLIVWGIEDEGHNIFGTTFPPRATKIGNEELENWLAIHLDPKIDVRIHEGQVDGLDVVLFEVPPATRMPTRFRKDGYIRVGSYTKPLRDHPGKEGQLWKLFHEVPFEEGVAAENVTSDDVLRLMNGDCSLARGPLARPKRDPFRRGRRLRAIRHRGATDAVTP